MIETFEIEGGGVAPICEYCDSGSCYTLMTPQGIRYYSCGEHKRLLEELDENFRKHKHLSKLR